MSRTTRGTKHQQLIGYLLEKLKTKSYIADFKFHQKRDRYGYPGQNKQFYFPFWIEFHDGDKWLIQSSTSYPRERINGYQWNAQHIKRIEPNIKKAFVIYPDSMDEDEIQKCIHYNEEILHGRIVSEIEGVISFLDLYFEVEVKALSHLKTGTRKDKEGRAFEEFIVDVFNHPLNVDIWNGTGDEDLGFVYPYFEQMLLKFGIKRHETIHRIQATNIIPNLTSGGKPKTDVAVGIQAGSNPLTTYTISSKRASDEWVTLHQFSASTYISVLGIVEVNLQQALYELERTGAYTQIAQTYQDTIANVLPNYFRQLALWSCAGIGGGGTPLQIANYFTIYNNNIKEFNIYNLREYIPKILSATGQMGTPFRYTYTGTRGTNIQLRGKVF